MQRLLLIVTAFVLTISLHGAQLSESSAATIATQFLNNQSSLKSLTKNEISPRLVHQLKRADETAVYVYGNNIAEGFVLIAGDDSVTPILGYSDKGSFDYQNMPENAKWWIDNYANQIQAIKEGKAVAATLIRSSTTVTPLLGEIVWGQDVPYNALAPSYEGKNCPTGCVATAMAQVMYYHKWPETGRGSKSYTSKTYKFELSADFSKSTYLWNNMIPTYNEQSSAESKEAVAKLMFDCGVAIEMDYDPNGSGTTTSNTAKAFIDNFNYDKGLRFLDRKYYTNEEWTALVKSELDASRPIMYGGKTGNGIFDEGHEFVCDGYNTDGLFHINWGWNGTSNGYFLLSLLDPDEQGTGGSTSGAGYNYMQQIIVGIQKPTDNPIVAPYFLHLYDENNCIVENKTDIRITGAIINDGYDLFSGTVFAELTDTSTGKSVLSQEIMTAEINVGYGPNAKSYSEKITPTSTLRGVYQLNYYSIDNNGIKFEVRTSIIKPIIIITDESITIKNRYSGLVVSNVKVKLHSSSSFVTFYNYSYDLTNTGEHDIIKENSIDSNVKELVSYDGVVSFTNEDYYNLKKGETITVHSETQISVSEGQELSFAFEDFFHNNISKESVKIKTPEYMIFLLEKASIKNVEQVDPKTFQLDATLKNVSAEEDYDGSMYAKIFRASDDQEMGVITATVKATMDQSVDVNFAGGLELVPGSYYATLFYDLENKSTPVWEEEVKNKIPFNTVISGIEDTKENNGLKLYPNPAHDYVTINTDSEPEYVRIFNSEGALLIEKRGTSAKNIQISHLTNGVYIVRANCSGKIVTAKMIKQ